MQALYIIVAMSKNYMRTNYSVNEKNVKVTLKHIVYAALEKERGAFVSGEELSYTADVSRTAIWKAISQLRADGHNILSSGGKGYMLVPESDVITKEGIQKYLEYGNRIILLDETDSTNKQAKIYGDAGADDGTVVLSKMQHMGRGRRGRSFFSPEGGLYFSIIFRPDISPEKSVRLTLAAAVSVCESINFLTGLDSKIKWINDIYLNNKKVCGILTEAVFGGETLEVEYAVIGIGINIGTTEFPSDIKDKAGNIVTTVTKNAIAAEIINRLTRQVRNIDSTELIKKYRKHCFVIGQDVNVNTGSSTYLATVEGVDDQGGLIVKNKAGTKLVLKNEEVSIILL